MSPNPPSTPPRRVAIYTKARDDEGLRRQRDDVERHIALHSNWTTVAVYEELAQTPEKRPALDRLLTDARSGAFDLVVTYDMTRVERSMEGFADIVQALNDCGVGVATSKERIDTQTTQGRLFLTLLTGFVDGYRRARPAHSRGIR